MNKFLSFCLLLVFNLQLFAQYPDYFEAANADTFIIDGLASESHWDNAAWYPLDNIWRPWGGNVDVNDFNGRIKFAWIDTVLLVFAEIQDDSLADLYENPLNNYPQDDCLEIFIDEDKSGGDHMRNYNAFAYHVSITGDVVDWGIDGAPMLFNEHIKSALIEDNDYYYWELAIRVYDDTYDEGGSNIPVNLEVNKEMGLNAAYCDSDGSGIREHFIGLVDLEQSDSNSAWKNADAFGTIKLIEVSNTSSNENTTLAFQSNKTDITLYPSYVGNNLFVKCGDGFSEPTEIFIFNLQGQLVRSKKLHKGNQTHHINVQNINPGIYIVNIVIDNQNYSGYIFKK